LPEHREVWIDLPNEWLGSHLAIRDQAVEKSNAYNSKTLTEVAVSMALLEDWNIPSLPSNPEKWDFSSLDMRLLVWVRGEVLSDFGKDLEVPKGLSSPLPMP